MKSPCWVFVLPAHGRFRYEQRIAIFLLLLVDGYYILLISVRERHNDLF